MERKLTKMEERLKELLDYGINPKIEFASKKNLLGEVIGVYDGGFVEYIVGKPQKKKFETTQDGPNADTTLYKIIVEEVGLTRADEIINDGNIQTEIEKHVLAHQNKNLVYTFELPSRFFMKKINPFWPESYSDEGESHIPDEIKEDGTTETLQIESGKGKKSTEREKSTRVTRPKKK